MVFSILFYRATLTICEPVGDLLYSAASVAGELLLLSEAGLWVEDVEYCPNGTSVGPACRDQQWVLHKQRPAMGITQTNDAPIKQRRWLARNQGISLESDAESLDELVLDLLCKARGSGESHRGGGTFLCPAQILA